MLNQTETCLTYVLANGDEKSVQMDQEKLNDFMTWFQSSDSFNPYELSEDTTLYKNTLLSVRYDEA